MPRKKTRMRSSLKMTPDWNIDSAIELYNIDRWGSGYFSINQRGNVEILPTKNPATAIDMARSLMFEGAEADFSLDSPNLSREGSSWYLHGVRIRHKDGEFRLNAMGRLDRNRKSRMVFLCRTRTMVMPSGAFSK